MSTKLNLHQRLLKIMSEAGTIVKSGYNDFNKYSYVREADVAEKFQKLLVEHGVFIYSSVMQAESKQVQSSGGKASILSTITVRYTFVNVDNPEETFEVFAAGDGMDVGDKAIYKALTGAHKYFLIRNFNLGSVDDAETESPAVGQKQASNGRNKDTSVNPNTGEAVDSFF